MKVNGITNNYSVNPYKNYKTTSVDKSESTKDTVEISKEAMNLLSDNSEIRSDKIANIKNRIAEGSYYIHSTDVVDKMLQNVINDKLQ